MMRGEASTRTLGIFIFVSIAAAGFMLSASSAIAQRSLTPSQDTAARGEAKRLVSTCSGPNQYIIDEGTEPEKERAFRRNIQCLESLILELTPVLFSKRGRSPEQMRAMLSLLGEAYPMFYRDLYGAHLGCDAQCRSTFRTVHFIEHRFLLETMIRDMVIKRYEYGINQ